MNRFFYKKCKYCKVTTQFKFWRRFSDGRTFKRLKLRQPKNIWATCIKCGNGKLIEG